MSDNGNNGNGREPILLIRNLTKTYMQGKIPVHALNDVSFEVEKGELISIVGPSGSGKSTLLSMIGLLDRPTGGSVFIEGQEITKANEGEARGYEGKRSVLRSSISTSFPHLPRLRTWILQCVFPGYQDPGEKKEPQNCSLRLDLATG